jgi:GNAT superfamily N-acetyltransferase
MGSEAQPVVELAERDTAPELAALHLRAAVAGYGHIFPPESPPPTLDEVTAQWSFWLGDDWEQGRRAFVARASDRVVGVVLTGPDPRDAALGHLARLYVEPDRWGQGIGRLLYAAALDQLRRDAFPTATLWVLEANAKARAWYERLGWRASGDRKIVLASTGIVDLEYRLELDASAAEVSSG